MPDYRTPGVYVEEVPSAIKPIAGVSTSTAGFIGVVPDPVADAKTGDNGMPDRPDGTGKLTIAPVGVPVLVDSWQTYLNHFGRVGPAGDGLFLARAVYGFFNNGGGLCWVTRIADDPAPIEEIKEALTGFAAIDGISLVAVPGDTRDEVQNALLDHCESAFLLNRFAILDGRSVTANPATAAPIQGGTRASSFAAIYYPWIDLGERDDDGAPVYQPPSGHLAGVYARVDSERGVFKAPANELIRGALGVQTLVSKQGQSVLNPEGINVIRSFSSGITVWGARTIASKNESDWKYVSSRRLFDFIRASIDEGTQWVVFEPNAEELWSKVRRNVSAFLNTVWASGALFGATPEEAFYVLCDGTTNPKAVRDLGQLVTEIGVALVNPAEFVVFRVSQWSGPSQ